MTEPAEQSVIAMEDSASQSSEPRSESRLKVKFRHWYPVGAWKWVAKDDACGICRFPFDACCTDCKMPGDDCPLVWGECSHCFHMHCIWKWVNSQTGQQQCPMCRAEWKIKSAKPE